MIYKSIAVELKADDEDLKERQFSGIAASFGKIDQGNDTISPKAFNKTLRESKGKIPILWQHSTDKPIGFPLKFSVEESGLHMTAELLDIPLADVARKTMQKIRMGLSIGYSVVKDAFDKESGVRNLLELKLWEVSVVTFPMDLNARLETVKNLDINPMEINWQDVIMKALHQEPPKKQDVDPEQIQSASEAITGLKNLFK